MKRLVLVLALALVAAGVAYAAAKPPIMAHPLGAGRLVPAALHARSFAIDAAKPADVLFVQVTIQPGGDFGWHIHRSAVAVAVVSGTLTLYDSSDPSCAGQRIGAGQGFMEAANHVHLARNEGKTPVRVLVAYLGAPHGVSPDAAAARPAQCAGIN
jgi:quercetin dioxygenase-like cupin family protein